MRTHWAGDEVGADIPPSDSQLLGKFVQSLNVSKKKLHNLGKYAKKPYHQKKT